MDSRRAQHRDFRFAGVAEVAHRFRFGGGIGRGAALFVRALGVRHRGRIGDAGELVFAVLRAVFARRFAAHRLQYAVFVGVWRRPRKRNGPRALAALLLLWRAGGDAVSRGFLADLDGAGHRRVGRHRGAVGRGFGALAQNLGFDLSAADLVFPVARAALSGALAVRANVGIVGRFNAGERLGERRHRVDGALGRLRFWRALWLAHARRQIKIKTRQTRAHRDFAKVAISIARFAAFDEGKQRGQSGDEQERRRAPCQFARRVICARRQQAAREQNERINRGAANENAHCRALPARTGGSAR